MRTQLGAPMSVSPPPSLSLTLRLLLGCGPLCAVDPRAAGTARHLPPAAHRRPALPLLLVPPGWPADRYAAPWHPPGDAPARLRSPGDSGVPESCRTVARPSPLPRHPEPQAAAGRSRGDSSVDTAGDPRQHLAPGTGDAACHRPAAVPGEGRVPAVPPGTGGAQGHLTLLSRWQVAFEALRDGFLGDVALDDLALTAGPCGAELSCSFEADACGLAASGQHTWLWQSNSTGTTAGPPADHTTGTAAGTGATASRGSGGALLPALPALPALGVLPAFPACIAQDVQRALLYRAPQHCGSPNLEYPSPRAPQPKGSSQPGRAPQAQWSPGAHPSRAGRGSWHGGFSSPPGHYMVVSTGRGSLPAGRAAALTSQPYQPSAPAQCLAFWYQLSAGTPGKCHDPPQGSQKHLWMVGGPAWHSPGPPPSMVGALGRLPRHICGAERGAEEGDGCDNHGGGCLAPRPCHCPTGWGLAGEMGQGARDLTAGRGTGWG